MDSTPHPGLLLETLGQLERATAQTPPAWTRWATAQSGSQFQRRMADCGQPQLADGIRQRSLTSFWFPHAIRPCSHCVKGCCVQPPYAENRTYGGVGGCRGAIPGTRPDLQM